MGYGDFQIRIFLPSPFASIAKRASLGALRFLMIGMMWGDI